MDLLHARPGIATCSNCGARFTYGLVGFRIFVIGLASFVVLSIVALSTAGVAPSVYTLAMPIACLASVLIGAFGLVLAGLKAVE